MEHLIFHISQYVKVLAHADLPLQQHSAPNNWKHLILLLHSEVYMEPLLVFKISSGLMN